MIRHMLGLSFFIGFLSVAIFTALYTQAELFLNNGYLPHHTGFLLVQMILLLSVAVFASKSCNINKIIFLTYLISTLFIVADATYLMLIQGLSIAVIYRNITAYWLYILVFPLSFFVKRQLSSNAIIKYFLLMTVASCAIGIFQYTTGIPIWILHSKNTGFNMYAADFHGQMRALGLFIWPISFGYFLAFVFGLFLEDWLAKGETRERLIDASLVVLSIITCYMTLTRAAFLSLALTGISVALIYYRKFLFLLFVPMLYLTLMICITYSAVSIHSIFPGIIITSSGSVIQRYQEWSRSLELVTHSTSNFLMGTGLTQGMAILHGQSLIIDNSFLALLLQNGFVGALLFLMLSYVIYIYLVRELKRLCYTDANTKELILKSAIVAFYSTWMAAGFINLNFIFPYILAFVYVVSGKRCVRLKPQVVHLEIRPSTVDSLSVKKVRKSCEF